MTFFAIKGEFGVEDFFRRRSKSKVLYYFMLGALGLGILFLGFGVYLVFFM